MIVFIAGMQRSGSTFCFNAVREMLQPSGTVYCAATDDIAFAQAASQGADHVVIKAHSAGPALIEGVVEGKIKSIISVRSIEDAISSCIDIWGISLDDAIRNLKVWSEMFRMIGPSSLKIPYEIIDREPVDAVAKMASYLSLKPDHQAIAASYAKSKVNEFVRDMRRDQQGVKDVGFSYYDEQTFFHRRHVISLADRNPDQFLTASDREKIQQEFGALGFDMARMGT